MVFSPARTRLKNGIHATLAKYGLSIPQVADLFGKQIQQFERRIREVFAPSAELAVIMSLPAVGFILGTVILLEV
jgi:hypothetical protein